MAIDYERLLRLQIPEVEHTYTVRDTILYALSVGYGEDALNPDQLRYVYERDLRAAPTMGVVLAHPGFWPKELDTGIDWVKVVHSDQGLILHRALPTAATVIGRSRVVEVVDKGPGKGAFVRYEREVFEKASGDGLCTITQTMYCRGDGGFGGPPRVLLPPHSIPERTPDLRAKNATRLSLPLLYRLNGDWNPLHADPEVARAAGFERPIQHGLATWGIAGREVVEHACDFDGSRVRSIDARFVAPVYPGETLCTELWLDGDVVSFRVRAEERDVVVVDRGRAVIAPPAVPPPP